MIELKQTYSFFKQPFLIYLLTVHRNRLVVFSIIACLVAAIIASLSSAWLSNQKYVRENLIYIAVDNLSNESDNLLRNVAQNITYGAPLNDKMMIYITNYRKSLYDFQMKFIQHDDFSRQMRLDEISYLGSDFANKLENIYSTHNAINDLVSLFSAHWTPGQQEKLSSDELVLYNNILYFLFMTFNHQKLAKGAQPSIDNFSSYIDQLNQRMHELPPTTQRQKIIEIMPQIAPIVMRYWSNHQDLNDIVDHAFYQTAELLEQKLNDTIDEILYKVYLYIILSLLLFIILMTYLFILYIRYQQIMIAELINTKKEVVNITNMNSKTDEFEYETVKHKKVELELKYIDLSFVQKSMDNDVEIIDLALGLFIDEHQYDIGILQRYLVEEKYEEIQKLLTNLTVVANNIGAIPLITLIARIKDLLKMKVSLSQQQITELKQCLKSTINEAKNYQQYLRSCTK